MRVLVTTTPFLGHFHPLVPFARALREAGHEVAFATAPWGVTAVEAAGFPTYGVGRLDPAPVIAARMGVDFASLGVEEQNVFALRHMFAGEQIAQGIRDLLELCREWPPDLILREQAEFAGCVAAERLDLPHAAVQVFLRDLPPHLQEVLPEPLGLLRAGAGLPPDPDNAMPSRYLWLCPFPTRFRWDTPPAPATLREVRHVPFDRAAGESLPGWLGELPARSASGGHPLVYATLGTIWGTPHVFRTVIEGLRGAPLSLVVTVGHQGDPAEYAPLPENVRVERYVPQSLLFPHCDAVVTHGGSGTLMAALDHALPLVLVPLAADQEWNADVARSAGAARVVAPAQLSPESVRAAVLDVLESPAYRRSAAHLGDENRSLPAPHRVVEWLERLARERAPERAPLEGVPATV